MRLHILSDLHTEFGDVSLPAPRADVVVLAGDTGIHRSWFKWVGEQFGGRTVVCVAGNHEYYGETIPSHTEKLRGYAREYGVHFLENESLVVGDVAFLGCTLWTDFALHGNIRLAASEAERQLTDYKRVKLLSAGRYLRLTPSDTARLHRRSLEWLREEIGRHAGRKIVVVTHHGPSLRSVPDQFRDDPLSAAYASSLDAFVASSGAQLWIHGHVHESADYCIGGTRVICNPRGYPEELNAGFQPGSVVEV
jgi:Icc-related predicted phosphoesterase